MRKGDSVKVYQKPITKEDFEGDATLVKLLNADMGTWEGRQFQRWALIFDDEPGATYNRTIEVNDNADQS